MKIAVSVVAVLLGPSVGCESNQAGSSNKPSMSTLMTMSLPERASMIQLHDPISRVEVLLGEPVEIGLNSTGPDMVESHHRIYKLSEDLWARILYADASDEDLWQRRWAQQKSDENPEAFVAIWTVAGETSDALKAAGAEAVRNGYRDWVVGQRHVEVLEGDQPSTIGPN